LIVSEQAIFHQMIKQSVSHNFFHDFTYNRGKTNWPVVIDLTL